MSIKSAANKIRPSGMAWGTFVAFAVLFAFVLYIAANGSLVKYKEFLL